MITTLTVRRRYVASATVAAALVCAMTLAGCGRESHPAAAPETSATPTATAAASPPAAPPPPPEALTDVLYRLTDTALPADQKVPLIEGATANNTAQIEKFGKALLDNQYSPLGFTAQNIAWSTSDPGDVTADVTVHSQNPALNGGFTFPMEFAHGPGGWQLSRQTADILLTLGQNQTPPS